MREMADILIASKSRAENHLHKLGYIINNCFDIWFPHKWKKSLLDCISACDSLLKGNENVLLLKYIVMGDEK